jgi:hypothetical protein
LKVLVSLLQFLQPYQLPVQVIDLLLVIGRQLRFDRWLQHASGI